jgi:hypothetical protein
MRSALRDAKDEMLKTLAVVGLCMIACAVLAQNNDATLSLDLAQQRARFARDQLLAAERKVQAAEKKEKLAQNRLEEAKEKAAQAAKQLQDAQVEFAQARERHDRAYQDLKHAHDVLQESNKQR